MRKRNTIQQRPESGIAVDASCLPCRTHKADGYFHGRCEHRAVDIATGEEVLRSRVFPQGTINLSEFLAIADALRMLHEKGDAFTPVYSDSAIAISWYEQGELRSKLPFNEFTWEIIDAANEAMAWLDMHQPPNPVLKWRTHQWGETVADFGRK